MDKNRAERRYRTEKVKHRRTQDCKNYVGKFWSESHWDDYRKYVQKTCQTRHPMSCGNSKCFCCHFEKLTGEKTVAQKKADFDFREQQKDCG